MKIEIRPDKLNIISETGEHKYGFGNIIGIAPVMKEIYKNIRIIASKPINILITGETGTGKELVAKAIHLCSDRKGVPFIPVECPSIPPGLLESEFFGHEKGAFTNAVNQTQGKFELAHKGIIFLDEIGDMDISLQVKMLRVLQERKFCRVGGKNLINTDVRIISATNRDLSRSVKEGKFRQDLYYRLNQCNLYMPPLRERKDDIPLLIEFFIIRYNKFYEKEIRHVSEDAMARLLNYDWTGNVRELENIIRLAVLMTEGDTIFPECMSIPDCQAHDSIKNNMKITNNHEIISLEKSEERSIRETLILTGGNKSKAARMLGISWMTLSRKMKKYNIT